MEHPHSRTSAVPRTESPDNDLPALPSAASDVNALPHTVQGGLVTTRSSSTSTEVITPAASIVGPSTHDDPPTPAGQSAEAVTAVADLQADEAHVIPTSTIVSGDAAGHVVSQVRSTL